MGVLLKVRSAAICAALSGLCALPVQADTLADALVAAYRNSNLLEQNRALLRASDEDVEQAIADIRPVVQFITTALTNTDDLPDYYLGFELSATMTLIDFGRGHMAIEAAHEQVLSTRAGLITVEQNVLFDAARAYLNLFTELQSVDLQRNSVTVISEQLRAARERFEAGPGVSFSYWFSPRWRSS